MDASSSSNFATTAKEYNCTYDRWGALKIIHEHRLSRCTRISVEGFDTSLPENDIRKALLNHFGPCGGIFDVKLPGDPGGYAEEGTGFIFFREKGAQEKAVELDGTDVGGWNVVVKALPKLPSKHSPEHVATVRQADYRRTHSARLFVRGYDTSLPAHDVRSALIKHFSSCGDITNLTLEIDPRTNAIVSSTAVLSVFGEDAEEKVLALSGRDMGGRKIVVDAFPKPPTTITRDPLGRVYGYTIPVCSMEKAEITAE